MLHCDFFKFIQVIGSIETDHVTNSLISTLPAASWRVQEGTDLTSVLITDIYSWSWVSRPSDLHDDNAEITGSVPIRALLVLTWLWRRSSRWFLANWQPSERVEHGPRSKVVHPLPESDRSWWRKRADVCRTKVSTLKDGLLHQRRCAFLAGFDLLPST